MKRSLSGLAFIAAVGLSAVGAQAQTAPPPSGSNSIEWSRTPAAPPPQDKAVAPAPGLADTPQNGDTKVEVDLRAPRIRCGDKTGEARQTCINEMRAEDQIILPADTAPRPETGRIY